MSPVLALAYGLALVGIGLGLAAAAPAPRLAGNWAAEGVALRTLTTGAIIQGRCAAGKITGAIALDGAGRFGVRGYFNPQRSGLRLSSIAPRDTPADFLGVVTGNTLRLTIRRRGMADQHHILIRGAPARFARCTDV